MLGSPPFLRAPRRALFPGAIVATIALGSSMLIAPAARASKVETVRAQTAPTENPMDEKAAEIASLNRQASQANAELAVLRNRISHDERLLASDVHPQRGPRVLARQSDGGTVSALSMFAGTSSTTGMMSRRSAPNAIGARPHGAAARRALHARHEAARHKIDQLTRAQADANAAIAAQNRALAHVRSDLISLPLIKRLQKGVQARIAAGRAIAAALSSATRAGRATRKSSRPTAVRKARTSRARHMPRRHRVTEGYANPLRSVAGLTPERIDSGVDYGGTGPVYAIGNGVVLNVYAGGWPNGVFIAYQLTDGPAKGLVVFTAEDLNPQVSVGASVTANTVLGEMFGGPHGIEIGWADGSQLPNAMARSHDQYHGGNSTAFGHNFSQLLQSLGAPGGISHNDATGALPAGWPQW